MDCVRGMKVYCVCVCVWNEIGLCVCAMEDCAWNERIQGMKLIWKHMKLEMDRVRVLKVDMYRVCGMKVYMDMDMDMSRVWEGSGYGSCE